MSMTMRSSLKVAVGEANAKSLARAFGMETVADLLAHYPRRYGTRGQLTKLMELPVGEQVTIIGEIKYSTSRQMKNRRGWLSEITISDGERDANLTFFDKSGWRPERMRPGMAGIVSGKVSLYKGQTQLTHPVVELFDDIDADDPGHRKRAEERSMEPIPLYPATAKLTSVTLQKLIGQVLDQLGEVADPLPAELRAQYRLLGAREGLEKIHRPKTRAEADAAISTLRWHEAFVLQSALLQQRESVRAMQAHPRPAAAGGYLARFDAQLPFVRTPDQLAVGEQIAADLVGDWPMNRLVQGEVGSGKTLVALRAMLQVAESGGQAALIAPTEVLAAQHLRSIARMLGPDLSAELMPTLLTGQMAAADRKKASLRVASGQARIVVGTHALLSAKTTFAELGLVVVDEQHRFGVDQREALRQKGTAPHALVLTATPIPRTVAMTVFGDLDVSTIRTLPVGRAGIDSHVVPLAERPELWQRTWARVAEEIADGRQVFAVCAAIDVATDEVEEAAVIEQRELDEDGGRKRPKWGVVQLDERLATHPLISQMRRAVIHGKMPADEKERIMQMFARGEIDLLIATTVIEVGVDVPNASTMVVVEADRFGVSQLHQLRGRVGRGEHKGLCLLVTEAESGTPARTRVEAVAATTDGFALAEVDLEARGEGDVLGQAQSGGRSSLKLLRVVTDAELIEQARAYASDLVAQDPALDAHPALHEAVALRVSETERAALVKN